MPTTGIEFDEDKYGMSSSASSTGEKNSFGGSDRKTSAMQNWLITHHLANSKKSADFVLLCIVAVNIIVTMVVIEYFI